MSDIFSQVLPADSSSINQTSSVVKGLTQPIAHNHFFEWINKLTDGWQEALFNLGLRVVLAILLFALGAWVIKHIKHLIMAVMLKRQIEGVAISLINSIVVALLYIGLGIGIASILGVQSVSFAAILASMGLAIGMALSGQLQNLAGGVIIVLTKPFTTGNFIHAQNVEGTVKAVTLFHTIVSTPENKTIYIPNGVLSNNVIINFNSAGTRRIEWIIGIDYEADLSKALILLEQLVIREERILSEPEHFVGVHALSSSSVDLVVRAWVNSDDYIRTLFAFNKLVFDEFNKAGISFPFPQVTISQRK